MSNEPQRRELTHDPLQTSDLSLDVAFEVLANARRRTTLSYLLRYERRAELEDLAAYVAASETTDVDERAAVTLHHIDLPKLADAGLIRYDADRRTAVADDLIQELEPYLEWARRQG